jgi:hypothetical protein
MVKVFVRTVRLQEIYISLRKSVKQFPSKMLSKCDDTNP